MPVAIALFALAAMVITLSASLLANVKLWGIVRESRRLWRELPPAQRRTTLAKLGWTYAVVAGAAAVVLTAPFGTRNTVLYFVILPVLVIGLIAITVIGVRGFRGQRQRRIPDARSGGSID